MILMEMVLKERKCYSQRMTYLIDFDLIITLGLLPSAESFLELKFLKWQLSYRIFNVILMQIIF